MIFEHSVWGISTPLTECMDNLTALNLRASNDVPVDVHKQSDAFIVYAEVPGVTKNQLKVSIKEDLVCIRAHFEYTVNDSKVVLLERRFGECYRKVRIPELLNGTVRWEDVRTQLENGILKIHIPYQEAPRVAETFLKID